MSLRSVTPALHPDSPLRQLGALGAQRGEDLVCLLQYRAKLPDGLQTTTSRVASWLPSASLWELIIFGAQLIKNVGSAKVLGVYMFLVSRERLEKYHIPLQVYEKSRES